MWTVKKAKDLETGREAQAWGHLQTPKATYCRGSEPEETDLRLNSEAGKLLFTAFAFL